MQTVSIEELKAGDRLVTEDNRVTTVRSCVREAIFEGDLYTVETDVGSFCLSGSDRVQIAPTETVA